MKGKFIAAMLICVIAACGSKTPKREITVIHKVHDESGATASKAIIETDNPQLKEAMQNGAIKGQDNMYYMPIGKDNGGCPYYTSFAPGKVTLTAVYYRRADGSFTNSRAEASCQAGK